MFQRFVAPNVQHSVPQAEKHQAEIKELVSPSPLRSPPSEVGQLERMMLRSLKPTTSSPLKSAGDGACVCLFHGFPYVSKFLLFQLYSATPGSGTISSETTYQCTKKRAARRPPAVKSELFEPKFRLSNYPKPTGSPAGLRSWSRRHRWRHHRWRIPMPKESAAGHQSRLHHHH